MKILNLIRASVLLISLLILFALSIGVAPAKEVKVVYDQEGVHLEYLLYTTREGALYCKDLSELWEENPLWIWNYVDDFWADAGKPGLFIVFKSFGQIRWVILDLTDGHKIFGGFLANESYGKLKGVRFDIKDKGAFITLLYYDEVLSKVLKEKYWVDIWGRRVLLESPKDTKKEN